MIILDLRVSNAAEKMETVHSTMKHSKYAWRTPLWTNVSIAIISVIWEGEEFKENNNDKRRYKQHEQN